MARPSNYTPEIASTIAVRLSEGDSLRTVCASEGMPDKATVFRWLSKMDDEGNWAHPEFRDQYARAREAQAEVYADEMVDIADDGTNDYMAQRVAEGEAAAYKENGENIRRSALRVDTRKWIAARLAPKKYGDRVTSVLEGGDKPVEFKSDGPSARELAKAMALTLAKGLKEVGEE